MSWRSLCVQSWGWIFPTWLRWRSSDPSRCVMFLLGNSRSDLNCSPPSPLTRCRYRRRNTEEAAIGDLARLQPSRLAKKIDGAQVVVVRSQEIDHAGEAGFTFQARQVMDTVIDNLARAIRKLAAAGVEHAVRDRRPWSSVLSVGSRRVDADRCAGRGRGRAAPPLLDRARRRDAGWLRPGERLSALGYESDLDFVFPLGSGVFKAGGDLAFHHGGPSLQELVIPVLTVRMKARETGARRPLGP